MRLKLPCRILPIAAALALASAQNSDPSHISRAHSTGALVTMDVIFDPDVAAGAAAAQNKPVPRAQDGHEWDGIAPVPDPAERTGSYDFHEFDVLANFDNDSMDVRITWAQVRRLPMTSISMSSA